MPGCLALSYTRLVLGERSPTDCQAGARRECRASARAVRVACARAMAKRLDRNVLGIFVRGHRTPGRYFMTARSFYLFFLLGTQLCAATYTCGDGQDVAGPKRVFISFDDGPTNGTGTIRP
jgi:hypothetical protein